MERIRTGRAVFSYPNSELLEEKKCWCKLIGSCSPASQQDPITRQGRDTELIDIPDPSHPSEHGHDGGGRRRGEHGGSGPGVGRHQRADAPGRARLGPPLPLPPSRLRRGPAVGGPPPDVAVLGAVPRQPLRLRRLLPPPRRRPHLRRRARHQRHHLRRHRRRRRAPRGGHARRARRARHRAHRPWSLGPYLNGLFGSNGLLPGYSYSMAHRIIAMFWEG